MIGYYPDMQLPCVCFRIKFHSDTAVLESHSHYGPCSFRQNRPQLRSMNLKQQKTTTKERGNIRQIRSSLIAARRCTTLVAVEPSSFFLLDYTVFPHSNDSVDTQHHERQWKYPQRDNNESQRPFKRVTDICQYQWYRYSGRNVEVVPAREQDHHL